ncbi:MAG: hypothetical protein P8J87_02590 [Verrucomicrobiales bacterium]|nr:hypothetical protein [Verrucomicrobiales bacterium]
MTPQKNAPPPLPTSPASAPAPAPAQKTILKGCLFVFFAVLAVAMVFALTLFNIYGTDTHHADPSSIWWTARGRNLIPPTASDITLQQDFLDHYATYTVLEKDLNAFLDIRFGRKGETLDSFSERSSASPAIIGTTIGPLGWVVTPDTVVYHYTAANGSGSTYHHDPTTGQTYQQSAYW